MAHIVGAPFFFLLFGIPFVLIGVYLIFGRFFVNAISRKHRYYGITKERIISVSGRKNTKMQSVNIKSIGSISYNERKDGSGTITLGAGISKDEKKGKMNFKGVSL